MAYDDKWLDKFHMFYFLLALSKQDCTSWFCKIFIILCNMLEPNKNLENRVKLKSLAPLKRCNVLVHMHKNS